jgi:hypothetical protein
MVTQEIVNDCAGNYEWPRRKKNRLRSHFCTRAQVEKTLNYTLVNFALFSISRNFLPGVKITLVLFTAFAVISAVVSLPSLLNVMRRLPGCPRSTDLI